MSAPRRIRTWSRTSSGESLPCCLPSPEEYRGLGTQPWRRRLSIACLGTCRRRLLLLHSSFPPRRRALDVGQSPIGADVDRCKRLVLRNCCEQVAGDTRQQRVGEDVIDVPRPTLNFRTPRRDLFDQRIVVSEVDPVALFQSQLDLAKLTVDDHAQSLIANRQVRHNNQPPEKRRRESLRQIRPYGGQQVV